MVSLRIPASIAITLLGIYLLSSTSFLMFSTNDFFLFRPSGDDNYDSHQRLHCCQDQEVAGDLFSLFEQCLILD